MKEVLKRIGIGLVAIVVLALITLMFVWLFAKVWYLAVVLLLLFVAWGIGEEIYKDRK